MTHAVQILSNSLAVISIVFFRKLSRHCTLIATTGVIFTFIYFLLHWFYLLLDFDSMCVSEICVYLNVYFRLTCMNS